MRPSDKRYSGRFVSILLASLTVWALIIARLYTVQIVEGQSYREIGKNQAENKTPIPAIRGNIYDRNQNPLTMNVPQYSFGARPQEVQDKSTLATTFAHAFGGSRAHFLRKLNSSQPFIWLERNIEKQKVSSLIEYEDPGLIIEMRGTRYYPYQEIGAQIIGTTNVDGKGITGLEAQYDSLLKGKSGWTILKTDGRGISMPSPRYPSIDPVHGHDVELTLDLEYQTIVEDALSRGLKTHAASTATAILMNPSTGAILAMASLPSYDPNAPEHSRSRNMNNRAVTNIFEPGSTLKIVTATAALAEHIYHPDDIFFCEQGTFRKNGKSIQDWKPFGWLTFEDIVANSSNIGTIKIAEKVGRDLLYQYLTKFGFGTKTGLNFMGEVPGIVHPLSRWTDMSMASVPIGYEVSVTALQLANAFAAIANDGYLMQPYLVNRIIDQSGTTIYRGKPQVIRRVAPRSAIRQVKNMLVKVVEDGTGVRARIEGMSMAGKTGTAQQLIDGEYSGTQHTSSFVGFLPTGNPRLLCAVILDAPEFGQHWGGQAAAPVARNIFSQIINSTDEYYAAADEDSGTAPITRDTQAPSLTTSGSNPVILTTQMAFQQPRGAGADQNEADPLRMPDVRGMSLRESLVTLYDLGLKVQITGYGRVTEQQPQPGTHLKPGTICELELKN